jgi:trigger factor
MESWRVKVTTEKLPQSLVSLQIELDRDRLERGLDQAARRLSQKYPVRGFRPGKAPRFIIEQTYGRAALLEEATEDLINKAYRDVLKQEQITPVGQPNLEEISSAEPFTFRVTIPVPPTVNVGDYRAIRIGLEVEPITDEQVERAMELLRDKHVVLQELDEARPAQNGDQLKVKLATIIPPDPDDEDAEPDEEEPSEQNLDLVQGRLIDELYQALLGANIGDHVEVTAQMPDDHANEAVRGKQITFKVEVMNIQQRLLPEWDDLPTLENFDGSIDELRAKTRNELEETAQNAAERKLLDAYIEELVAGTEYDVPKVMVHELAESMLEDQGRQFERYGITLDQMLQYRGKTRENAIEELMPDAERQTKVTLALREIVEAEELQVSPEELSAETARMLHDYPEEDRANVANILSTQLLNTVANAALDRKLRARLVAIATGTAPDVDAPAAAAEAPAPEAEAPAPDEPVAEASTPEAEAPAPDEPMAEAPAKK